jgi:hypothetical protein
MFENLLNAFTGENRDLTSELLLRAMPARSHAGAQRAVIPYVIFQISCEPGVDISAPMAAALKVIRKPGCRREATISTLMFVTFPGVNGSDGLKLCDSVADDLLRQLGQRVRMVRGTLTGVMGHIGRGNNYLDGSAFIGVEKLCAALFSQPYGTSVTLDLVPKEESRPEHATH